MSRLRVCVLLSTSRATRAGRGWLAALPHLDRERFDYAFAAADDDGALARAVRGAGHPFHVLPPRASPARHSAALRSWLRQKRADLLHSHAVAWHTRVALRGLPTRWVAALEAPLPDASLLHARWRRALAGPAPDAVVVESTGARAELAARAGPRTQTAFHTLAAGVDLDALARAAARAPSSAPPEREGASRLLVPASLLKGIGHDTLLAALTLLEQHRAFDVWLVGDGPRRPRLARRAERFHGGIRVHLLGQRSDVPALMRRADLVWLPTTVGAPPRVLLEARALGCAVIASANWELEAVVAPERDGLLVAPHDPLALARALSALAGDAVRRERLGRAAAADARERFDIRNTLRGLEEIYFGLTRPLESATFERGELRRAASS